MQKRQSPNIFLCVFKNLFSKKHKYFWKHIEKCWDSVVFALIFQKNIEKVWDIEKICNIAKFRKNQGKNNRVPTFFNVKLFRWTRLIKLNLCKQAFYFYFLLPFFECDCYLRNSKTWLSSCHICCRSCDCHTWDIAYRATSNLTPKACLVVLVAQMSH